MRGNLQGKLNEIIGKSNIQDKELKNVLIHTFSALATYEDAVLQDVEGKVNMFLDSGQTGWNRVWNITTALVKAEDVGSMTEKGFREIHVGNSCFGTDDNMGDQADLYEHEEQFFLNCPYERLSEICSKAYVGSICCNGDRTKTFTYYLVPQYRFVEQEYALFRLADIYHITKPVIYSPYARHAVDVRLEHMALQDVMQHHDWQLDLNLKENGLEHILITGHRLMWNVEIADSETVGLTPLHQSQDTGGYEWFYDDVQANTFLYPIAPCDEINKGKDKIEIFYRGEPASTQYKKITISETSQDARYFENNFRSKGFDSTVPLRTKADMAHVLSRFQNESFSCKFSHMVKKSSEYGGVVCRYKKEHKYAVDSNELYLTDLRYKPCCAIAFGGEGTFLTDYANYVLHFMEQHYPEFTWIGITGREEK